LKRICFINPTKLPKAEIYDLANHLPRKKFDVVILQPKAVAPTQSSEERLFSSEGRNNFEVIGFPCLFVPGINYTVPLFRKQLKIVLSLLEEKKFDIIQVADYFYMTSVLPALIKRRHDIPIILTVNALPGYSWYFGDIGVDLVAKIYTHSIGRFILNSYDRVIPLYRKISEEVGMLGVPREKISVIPNGVDFEKFDGNRDGDELRNELLIKDDEKVLLFVGRLVKVKRVNILVKVTERLLKEGFNVKTVIVGDGPMRKYYEKLSRSLGDNVLFTGYVPKKRLLTFYYMADIFILPSLSEGLPAVLLEASAAGRPCVASCVNGVPDIIEHWKTGFLTRNSSASAYYHFAKILLTDEDVSERMGKNAREHVRKNFDWNTIVKKYMDIYSKILAPLE
jgi:glycosyltransferase involved in cell wall biosynthesis